MQGKQQDPVSADLEASLLTGRASNADLPACVELNDSFDTFGYFAYQYYVQVPEEAPFLYCSVKGGWTSPEFYNEFSLKVNLQNPGEDTYCSNTGGPFVDELSCFVAGDPFVNVRVEYTGPPTTITLHCSNKPCTDPVCGDGFCSNELESPLPLDAGSGAATETSCKQDCGYFCPIVSETLSLDPLESVEFEVDV